jgi:hypothetical protein
MCYLRPRDLEALRGAAGHRRCGLSQPPKNGLKKIGIARPIQDSYSLADCYGWDHDVAPVNPIALERRLIALVKRKCLKARERSDMATGGGMQLQRYDCAGAILKSDYDAVRPSKESFETNLDNSASSELGFHVAEIKQLNRSLRVRRNVSILRD